MSNFTESPADVEDPFGGPLNLESHDAAYASWSAAIEAEHRAANTCPLCGLHSPESDN